MTSKYDRLFIRVDVGMPDHPKVVGLSDRAFRLLVSLWTYSQRHLTDGLVPAGVAHSRGKRAAAELMAADLLHEVDGGYQCHDYTDHQQTREHVQAVKKARSEAGKKGGRPKASAKQPESKLVSKLKADIDIDIDKPPVVPLEVDVQPADTHRQNGRKRPATPLPDDWKPNDGHLEIANERGLDPKAELVAFRDYATSVDWRKVDWDATFRNWLRKANPGRSKPADDDVPYYWRKPSA